MSLLDKLRKAYKGVNRTESNNKSKGSSSKTKTKPKKKEDNSDKQKKTSTSSQNSSKSANRGSQGANRTTSKAVTKTAKTSAPSDTGWSAYVKKTLSNGGTSRAEAMGATKTDVKSADKVNQNRRTATDTYRKKVQEQAKTNAEAKEKEKKAQQEELQKKREQKKKEARLRSLYALENNEEFNKQKETYRNSLGDNYYKLLEEDGKKNGYGKKEIDEWLKTDEGKKAREGYVNANMIQYDKDVYGAVGDDAEKSIGVLHDSKVAAQEAKDKQNLAMTRAGQLGATAEDKVQANKQSAITNTELFNDHHFTAGLVTNALPSAWGATEWGDSAYYTDEQKEKIENAKHSLGYMGGALVGGAIQFAVPASLGANVAGKVIKGGSAAGKLFKTASIQTAIDTPLNAMMSYKDAKDINGNVIDGAFAKNMAFNTGLDFGLGSAIGGVGMGLTKLKTKKLIDLQTRANNGTITSKEADELINLYESLGAKANETASPSSNIADEGVNEANSIAENPSSVTGNGKVDEITSTPKWKVNRDAKKAAEKLNSFRNDLEQAKTDVMTERITSEKNAERKARLEERQVRGRTERQKRTIETERKARLEEREAKGRSTRLDRKIDNAISSHNETVKNNRRLNELNRALKKKLKPNGEPKKGQAQAVENIRKEIERVQRIEADKKPKTPLTYSEGRELARLTAKEEASRGRELARLKEAGTVTALDKMRIAELREKIKASEATEPVSELPMAETPRAEEPKVEEVKAEETPTEPTEMPTRTEGMPTTEAPKAEEPKAETKAELTEKQERYKSVGVGHKEVSELTDEQLKNELKHIEIIRRNSQKKNGAVSENQKIREERYKEVEAELKKRGGDQAETVAEPKEATPATGKSEARVAFEKTYKDPNYFPSEHLKRRVALADELGVDIDAELKQYADNAKEGLEAEGERTAASKAVYQKVADAILEATNNNKKVGDYLKKTETEQRLEGTTEKVMENAEKGEMSGKEIADATPAVREKGEKPPKTVEDDFASKATYGIKKGRTEAKKEAVKALETARKKVEKDADFHYKDVMNKDSGMEDTVDAMATRTALMEKYAKEGDVEKYMKVLDKDTEIADMNGYTQRVIGNLKEATPEARIRYLKGVADRLSEAYKGRIRKGEKIEFAKEDVEKIMNAKDADEAIELMDKAYAHMWDNIDATWFEKFNEIRHFSMLFNVKTHLRNITGNTVYALVRQFAEMGEWMVHKIPAVEKRIETLSGGEAKNRMVRVGYGELLENKATVDKYFDTFYGESGSTTRYKENARPDGSKTFKHEAFNKPIQANYNLLEWEDVKLALRPTFRKNFMRYAKSEGWKDISNLTEEQLARANEWALAKAEEATFRDTTWLSQKITKLKQTTATKKGNTVVGTAMYRAGNMALESALPFVKTPINIMARSIDYSPVGLFRSFFEIASKDADTFMKGIHHMCTGMTGMGVAAVGMWAMSQGFVTIKTGQLTGNKEVDESRSGDSYMDRDMGFQDYSLIITNPFTDKTYSCTIDWAAPLQSSFFMGAAFVQNARERNEALSLEGAFDMMTAMSAPMLDMSFMSGTKDTIETFMEKVYHKGSGEDADWSGAMMQMVLGSIPQNYMSGFIPQLSSQAAQFTDNYQRDTRSTEEDTMDASWDRFKKQLKMKVPVLRKTLNQKVDRKGDLVTSSGSNLFTRFVFSCISPTNVKKINITETDKELIKIQREMPEGDKKKYFFYNFTGNPQYDLVNDKRMTDDELFTYGKEKRGQQYKYIEDMIASGDRYNCMTPAMKAEEVDRYNWISNTDADIKTYAKKYGYKFVADHISDGDSGYAETLKDIRTTLKTVGGNDKQFANAYLAIEKLQAQTHSTDDYHVKALALCKQPEETQMAWGVYGDKIEAAKKYYDQGGTDKEFATGYCEGIAGCQNAKVGSSKPNRSRAMAEFDNIPERAYRAMGYDWNHAQAGAGLKKYGFSAKDVNNFKTLALLGYDKDHSNSLTLQEAIDFVEGQNYETDDIKACVFASISDANNPYGTIEDHLKWGTEPDETKKKGGRRRRRGHGGGGYGGGGSGSGGNDDWYAFVKDMTTASSGTSAGTKLHDYTKPSKLDEAYRKRVRKLNS